MVWFGTSLLLVGFGLVVGGFGWVCWLLVGLMRDQSATMREMLLPQPQPEPPPPSHEPPRLTRLPVVDPTDRLIPDVGDRFGLADAFPNVDPWLIGEVELPETVAEVEIDPDGAEVMLPDGTWVPLDESLRDNPAAEDVE